MAKVAPRIFETRWQFSFAERHEAPYINVQQLWAEHSFV